MRIYDGRNAFYQWDTEQKVVSHKLEVGDKVHFFNQRQPTALITVAYKLDGKVVADVPNILLQQSLPLIVYHTVENEFGFSTREEFTFSVTQRARPDNYVYTETEVLNYNSLDKRVTDLEKGGGGSGGVDTAEVERIVEEYLEENPPTPGKNGEPGKDGADGGYYTPEAYQIDEATFALNFIPSKDGMEDDLRYQIVMPEGKPGKDGETPVRGEDYWTEADKAEIKGYVDEAILGGAW